MRSCGNRLTDVGSRASGVRPEQACAIGAELQNRERAPACCWRPLASLGVFVSTVLIIDDEPGIRFALRRWFERQGWKVEEAGDGDAALSRLREVSDDGDDRFDVIVCDVHLPRRSGASLLALLHDERPALVHRIILSTGDDITNAEPGSLLQSHSRVLQKPFDLATLRALVHAVCPSA